MERERSEGRRRGEGKGGEGRGGEGRGGEGRRGEERRGEGRGGEGREGGGEREEGGEWKEEMEGEGAMGREEMETSTLFCSTIIPEWTLSLTNLSVTQPFARMWAWHFVSLWGSFPLGLPPFLPPLPRHCPNSERLGPLLMH